MGSEMCIRDSHRHDIFKSINISHLKIKAGVLVQVTFGIMFFCTEYRRRLKYQYFKEEYDADFVFVTHYPSKKRPFYAMDDPADPTYTLSFDLLYQGLEITTGGQRIHDYNMLLEKIEKRGMTTEGMEQYMDTFKHGMPPHGGLGIGLERLTMKLVGEDNVRETTLYPRDLSRLEP